MSVPLAASPRAEMRMLVGYVLLAPFCGLVAYLTAIGQAALDLRFPFNGPPGGAALPAALAVTVFAAPIATIFGAVPGVAWLIRRGQLTLPKLLLSGMALGNIPVAILAVLVLLEKFRNGTLRSLEPLDLVGVTVLGAWFGVCGALFFWFVSIRGTELDSRTSNLEPRTAN